MRVEFSRKILLQITVFFLGGFAAVAQQGSHGNAIDDVIVRGDINTVITMINANHSLINTKRSDDFVPIHYAVIADKNQYELVEFLLKSGADVNARSRYGDTPLSIATHRRELNVAKLLLHNDANVNTRDDSGWTPRHKAASQCDQEMAALLLSSNANPNLRSTDFGGTPLHLAVECKKAMIELLIAKGADANVRNSSGRTPLDLAIDSASYYKDTNKDDTELKQVIEVLRRHTTSRDAPH